MSAKDAPKDSSEPKSHNGNRMGEAAHRVIGQLLAAGIDDPTPEDILFFAAREPILEEPHIYRLAGRQRLIASTAIYWRRFLPDRMAWRFVDFEVPVTGSSLDLVFQNPAGEVRSDELKTGGTPALSETKGLDKQLECQLAGGARKYRRRYLGARVVFLGAPHRSFFATCDGLRTPLGAGETHE